MGQKLPAAHTYVMGQRLPAAHVQHSRCCVILAQATCGYVYVIYAAI
jgi:hypothetical protein